MDGPIEGHLRGLPSVQRLLEHEQAARLSGEFGRAATVDALRAALEGARAAVLAGADLPTAEALLADAGAGLYATPRPGLVRVINATGIILHTNLGRAPLPDTALAAIADAAGYCSLEFDLADGSRGSRTQGVEPLLREITGAEAGLAVNNAAAAVLLSLAALAGSGEVVVSRGELVEIGGGFRIPDVIRQGGARLVEVGTTNKTRLSDYREAIGPDTRMLLKVHQSNFRMTGFTEQAPLAGLAGLAQEHGLHLVHDLGSGAVVDLRRIGPLAEATVQESVAAGADLVAFSGDKLMGGPQAGLLVGRAATIDKLRLHPLLRAVRLDKLSLAALEAVLRLHATGRSGDVPVLRMMGQDVATLRARAERLAGLLGEGATVEDSAGFAGGGTLPDAPIPSLVVSLAVSVAGDPERLAARLRRQRPAIVGRIAGGRLLLDMLTVVDNEVAALASGVKAGMEAARVA